MLHFHFHSVQCFVFDFFFFFETSPLTMDYLNVCCLVSKYLEFFLFSFCYCFLVWLHCNQRTQCEWLQYFKLVEIWFMARDMVSLGIRSVTVWTECVLLFSGGVVCKCQLDLTGWWRCWVLLYPCWFSTKLFYQLLREGCGRLCGFFYFSFQFYHGLSLLAT